MLELDTCRLLSDRFGCFEHWALVTDAATQIPCLRSPRASDLCRQHTTDLTAPNYEVLPNPANSCDSARFRPGICWCGRYGYLNTYAGNQCELGWRWGAATKLHAQDYGQRLRKRKACGLPRLAAGDRLALRGLL